jgi:hypothetical protein
MVRVTRGVIVTIEDEADVSHRHTPRNYRRVFETLGMVQVSEEPCGPLADLPRSFVARVFKAAQ